MSRPTNDEGHAYAAFIKCTFLPAEIVCSMPIESWSRTIIACEDDDGVLVDTQVLQSLHEAAYLFVEFCKHDGEVMRGFSLRCLIALINPRCVNIIRPQADEARFAFVTREEVKRFIDEISSTIPTFNGICCCPNPVR